MRLSRVLAGVVCAGVIGSACSSSPSLPHKSSSPPPRTTTTGSGVPSAITSTSTGTTAGTGITACTRVQITPGQSQGAAGTIIGTITLSEVGSASCTLLGYPTLTRFDASGSSVPVTVVDGLTVNVSGAAAQPPSSVTLTPTQHAEFTYQYSDVPVGSETTCAGSTTITVTTPGATAASSPAPLTMAPCNSGTVEVSPLYAAATTG
jgi:hypothetical protein